MQRRLTIDESDFLKFHNYMCMNKMHFRAQLVIHLRRIMIDSRLVATRCLGRGQTGIKLASMIKF